MPKVLNAKKTLISQTLHSKTVQKPFKKGGKISKASKKSGPIFKAKSY